MGITQCITQLHSVGMLGRKHLELDIEELVAECLQNTAHLGRHCLYNYFNAAGHSTKLILHF